MNADSAKRNQTRSPNAREHRPSVNTASDLGMAMSCPKFDSCSAPYCPAIGGTHLRGEPVCHYLKESVKADGQARVRGSLSKPLADTVIKDGLRLINTMGPLSKPLRRASKQGSRMDSIERAARSRKCFQ
jgi:hypothetical protein